MKTRGHSADVEFCTWWTNIEHLKPSSSRQRRSAQSRFVWASEASPWSCQLASPFSFSTFNPVALCPTSNMIASMGPFDVLNLALDSRAMSVQNCTVQWSFWAILPRARPAFTRTVWFLKRLLSCCVFAWSMQRYLPSVCDNSQEHRYGAG